MPEVLDNYYNRFDAAKNYDMVMIRDGYAGQGAEMNEIQSAFMHRIKGISDCLFRDGDIVRDARISVDPNTGSVNCESGAIYLSGAVRGVSPATIAVPIIGLVTVGVYLQERVITELEDPSLYNPAKGSSAEGEAGAGRLQVNTAWGWQSSTTSDGQMGEFFPVYTLDDANVRAKEAPPNLDAVTQALARYDKDSSGGNYIVSGFNTLIAADTIDGRQVYTVREGRARVNGLAVDLSTSRRLSYAALPDLLGIDSEPHAATSSTSQRIDLDRYPVAIIKQVRITKESTTTLTHGAFTGAADPLPDSAVLDIMEVKQGGVTYSKGTDYKLTAGKVDWSLAGIEPATGSTYDLTYRHIKTIIPDSWDNKGLVVTGAVIGSLIQVSYDAKLPRIDRLAISEQGEFIWFKGIPADYNPRAPEVPRSMLPLATVMQSWDESRKVINDGVRVVPMDDIAAINERMDWLTDNIAQQRLTADINLREASAKKGIFVDPFFSDAMRDQGVEQTAAIVGGELTLPISEVDVTLLGPTDKPKHLSYTIGIALEQAMRTGSMRVNPYSAFEPIPAEFLLNPAIDRWTETQSKWASAITERFSRGSGNTASTSTTVSNRVTGTTSQELEFLRQISVEFTVKGFGPNENILSLSFDGIGLDINDLSQKQADSTGQISSSFVIPADIPAGAKMVEIVGSGGSRGVATFVGQGTLTIQTLQQVTSITTNWYSVDPLAQTFNLQSPMPLAGVDLWFTKKGTSIVVVQIREASVGLPNQTVLAAARIAPSAIFVNGLPTRILFDAPVMFQAGTEYALVIMCDDAEAELAIAEVGKWDINLGQWVTAQPYQVGVLLSSSNASTWTPHQDRDLAFRLLRANYNPEPINLDLGKATVAEVTDIMVMSLADQPTAATRVEYNLTLPDATQIKVAEGQPVRFAENISGDISIIAKLIGSATASPVLYPGVQLVHGKTLISASYVSRAILGGADSRIRIILDAAIPSGSSLTAHHADGAANSWAALEFKSSQPIDSGFQEMTFEGSSSAEMIRIRLTLAGTSALRPRVRNLRVLVL